MLVEQAAQWRNLNHLRVLVFMAVNLALIPPTVQLWLAESDTHPERTGLSRTVVMTLPWLGTPDRRWSRGPPGTPQR